jgi:hypothetical protein
MTGTQQAAIQVRRLTVGDEEIVRRLSIEDARFERDGVAPKARTPHTIESARAFLSPPRRTSS